VRLLRVVTTIGALCLTGGSSLASGIDWSVINNFGLLANRDTQARYMAEKAAFLACMKRTFSPGQCDNRRNTHGLTQEAYSVRFNPKTLTYDPTLLHPREGDAADTVMVEMNATGASSSERCDWTISGKTQKSAPCKAFRAAVKIGEDVDISVDPRGKGRSEQTVINIRRVVIATFGDSFMSGEGNPHMRSRVEPVKAENWLEPRCHRSLLTASAVAAANYAERNPRAYVAYYNFACSGSTSDVGVIGPYQGVMSSRLIDNLRGPDEPANHFRGDKIPSQIDQAKQTFCGKSGCISPDVIFLSIGINTLGFSDTIVELGRKACDAKCLRALEGRIQKGVDVIAGDGPASLRNTYAALSRALKPKTAFAIEYPDPTRDDKGAPCDDNALFPILGRIPIGRIDKKENDWAYSKMVVPLNDAVADAVKASEGWELIRGTMDATRRHGFCAKQTFFNSGQDAKGTSGTMHPNVVGHDAVGVLLSSAMGRVLN
jgi:hypothetical protein